MSEFHGVIEKSNGIVALMCCRCHRFMRYEDSTTEVIPQFGEPHDPEYEYVHRACPPKKAKS